MLHDVALRSESENVCSKKQGRKLIVGQSNDFSWLKHTGNPVSLKSFLWYNDLYDCMVGRRLTSAAVLFWYICSVPLQIFPCWRKHEACQPAISISTRAPLSLSLTADQWLTDSGCQPSSPTQLPSAASREQTRTTPIPPPNLFCHCYPCRATPTTNTPCVISNDEAPLDPAAGSK